MATAERAPPSGSRVGRRADSPSLSFAEWVCLVLIDQKVDHGWALGTMLAPDGDVGRMWALSRPLTYRAIDGLVDKGLVARRGQVAGRGRDRVLLAPTSGGRRWARRWLDRPVEHLRDVRTELLVKLWLRERAGLDNEPLLLAQRERLQPTIDALTSAGPEGDLVDLWRRESARAVRRFLDEALRPPVAATEQPELRLSARNQVRGTVVRVLHGEVMSSVTTLVAGGGTFTAAITREAATDLDLAPGDAVILVVKATEVIVAKPTEP